jgi:hypothetical protein
MDEQLSLTEEAPPWDSWTIQLHLLTRDIEADPDSPVNYLLRGEEWLAREQWEQAGADFETALELAGQLLEQSAWGYVYQSYVDRAEAGLRQCSRED